MTANQIGVRGESQGECFSNVPLLLSGWFSLLMGQREGSHPGNCGKFSFCMRWGYECECEKKGKVKIRHLFNTAYRIQSSLLRYLILLTICTFAFPWYLVWFMGETTGVSSHVTSFFHGNRTVRLGLQYLSIPIDMVYLVSSQRPRSLVF